MTIFERQDWTLFRNLSTLGQRAGVTQDVIPRLIVKELVDNALDSGGTCRYGQTRDGWLFVEDDGNGLIGADEEIAALFSVCRPLASSKLFRLPSRGALGNGLRVVAGAVLASGGKLVVKSRGRAFARSPLPDSMTVGELRTKIHAANAKAPVGTPAELAAALLFLADPIPGGYVGNLKSRLLSARSAVDDARTRARQTLIQTAADTRPDPELTKMGAKIDELKRRIAGRRPTLEAEGKVNLVRAECEQLARGERPPSYSSVNQPGQQPTPLASLYREARKRLDQLLDMVGMKQDAEKANAADQAELAKLEAKVAEARNAALQRLAADPKTMRWCE